MELSARGWNRNMGPNRIGKPDVGSATEQYNPTRNTTSIKNEEDKLRISWYADIKLTGSYRVQLILSKSDIAIIFKKCFGDELSLVDLESIGLKLTNEGLREKLASMTIGDFSHLLSGDRVIGQDDGQVG